MIPDREPSNATLLAKMGEVFATLVSIQRQLDSVMGLPVKVAQLEKELEGVKSDVEEFKRERDMGQNLSLQRIGIVVLGISVMVAIVFNILQTVRLG